METPNEQEQKGNCWTAGMKAATFMLADVYSWFCPLNKCIFYSNSLKVKLNLETLTVKAFKHVLSFRSVLGIFAQLITEKGNVYRGEPQLCSTVARGGETTSFRGETT